MGILLAGLCGGCANVEEPEPDGGSCTEPSGTTYCIAGNGSSCCGGVRRHFFDGPCWQHDASRPLPDGGTLCEVAPTSPGCACSTEGAIDCNGYGWRRLCRGGVWYEQMGMVCC